MAYGAGSSETGDAFAEQPVTRLHLALRGRDVVLTSVFIPYCAPHSADTTVRHMEDTSLDHGRLDLRIAGCSYTLDVEESTGCWSLT